MTLKLDVIVESGQTFESVNPYWEAFLAEAGLAFDGITGDGCYVRSRDGRVWLDCIAGFGTASLGHSHGTLLSCVAALVKTAAVNVFPFECPESQKTLADRLIGLSRGSFGKVFLANTGAEAVESAVKFALVGTQRRNVVTFKDSFHGLSMFSSFLTGNPFWTDGISWRPDNIRVVDSGDISALEDILEARDVAAVIFEPVPGSSSNAAWTAESSTRLAELCRSTGTKLIADEVYCGLGRTGTWFAYQTIGMPTAPDMVVVSKTLTGGLVPISAVLLGNEDFDAVFGRPGRAKIHGSTFAGNRLAVGCALAVLDILESQGAVQNASRIGAWLMQEISARLSDAVTPIGAGLAIHLRLNAPDRADLFDIWTSMIEKGVLAIPNAGEPASIRLSPPLTFGMAEAERLMNCLSEVFST